jgi:hypothetical protein
MRRKFHHTVTASRTSISLFRCILKSLCVFELVINPLKAKRICFMQGLSAYRSVNSLHFGYKNQSLNVL